MSDHCARRLDPARCFAVAIAVAVALSGARAAAQGSDSKLLTLDEAVGLALKNHPAIRESRARARAANEGVSVAQAAYFPRVDLLWQQNRATRNNVFGL